MHDELDWTDAEKMRALNELTQAIKDTRKMFDTEVKWKEAQKYLLLSGFAVSDFSPVYYRSARDQAIDHQNMEGW